MNPNEYWEYSDIFTAGIPFNKAVSQVYEPGSVFKILTMASAIDAGAVKPDTEFVDNGYIDIGGVTIYNWDRSAWGPQTMLGCMQHSLNVCLSWVATELGAEKFYEYLDNFGIGTAPTSISPARKSTRSANPVTRCVRSQPGHQFIRSRCCRDPHPDGDGSFRPRQ